MATPLLSDATAARVTWILLFNEAPLAGEVIETDGAIRSAFGSGVGVGVAVEARGVGLGEAGGLRVSVAGVV